MTLLWLLRHTRGIATGRHWTVPRIVVRSVLSLLLALSLLPCLLAHSQDAPGAAFPTHPVKLVVAFPPGGSTDITARLLAAALTEKWHQPVIVENRPGAGATIGTAWVARAPADGHTILVATTALAISSFVYQRPGYDALRDLAPVTMISSIPNVLVVNPAVPADTIEAFVAYAKANPGKLNFAAPGASSGQRLTFERIKQVTGIDLTMVAYGGGATALQAVLAGQVDAMIVNVVEAAGHVRSGKLRALAATTAERAPMLPEVPTLAETVAPGIDASVWQGVFVPAATPGAVIERIRRDVDAALTDPTIRERLAGMGMVMTPGGPDALASLLRDDMVTWRHVAEAAGVKPE